MFSLDIASSPSRKRWEAVVVGALLLALFVLPRIFHLGEIIDEPHSWVQADREFSVWAYSRHGLSLVDMHVCYFGGYRTNILEFPLPNLLPAVLYQLFGPYSIFARLVTLLLFAGAAFYLYRLVEYLFDRRLAVLTLAVYLVLPLGLFYSRAILMHDFMAIFMAHAMAYLYLRGFDEDRSDLLAAGCACATLGMLVKAPYVFYFFLPLGVYFVRAGRPARLIRLAPVFALPVVPFALWRYYVNRVNGQHPDWSFLPGYLKFDDMAEWYYGPLEMRFDPANWFAIGDRVGVEVFTPAGVVLFALGLLFLRGRKNVLFVCLWAYGALVAIAIFFRLNLMHDYYQNPLIAIAAVGIAGFFWRILPERPVSPTRLMAGALGFALFALSCVGIAEYSFYKVDWYHHDAGRAIAEMTREEDLVIAISPLTLTAQDARALGRAHRYGWPVPQSRVTPALLERLRQEGATVVAWVQPASLYSVPAEVQAYLAGAPVEVRDLPASVHPSPSSGVSESTLENLLSGLYFPRNGLPETVEGGSRLYVYRIDGPRQPVAP